MIDSVNLEYFYIHQEHIAFNFSINTERERHFEMKVYVVKLVTVGLLLHNIENFRENFNEFFFQEIKISILCNLKETFNAHSQA